MQRQDLYFVLNCLTPVVTENTPLGLYDNSYNALDSD